MKRPKKDVGHLKRSSSTSSKRKETCALQKPIKRASKFSIFHIPNLTHSGHVHSSCQLEDRGSRTEHKNALPLDLGMLLQSGFCREYRICQAGAAFFRINIPFFSLPDLLFLCRLSGQERMRTLPSILLQKVCLLSYSLLPSALICLCLSILRRTRDHHEWASRAMAGSYQTLDP